MFHVHFTTQASLIFIFIFSFAFATLYHHQFLLCSEILQCCHSHNILNWLPSVLYSFLQHHLCVLVSLLKKHTLFSWSATTMTSSMTCGWLASKICLWICTSLCTCTYMWTCICLHICIQIWNHSPNFSCFFYFKVSLCDGALFCLGAKCLMLFLFQCFLPPWSTNVLVSKLPSMMEKHSFPSQWSTSIVISELQL